MNIKNITILPNMSKTKRHRNVEVKFISRIN